MLFEPKIGKLIRRLNPYTSGAMYTMLCGTDPTNLTNLTNLGTDLTNLGMAITAYAAQGAQTPANLATINTWEEQLNLDLSIADIPVRADNDFRQDYMTWTFRNQPYAVKRALRITYRYELTDPSPGTGTGTFTTTATGGTWTKTGTRTGTGVFGTEHVLIGYAGSNG
jgi:hypothetical protein